MSRAFDAASPVWADVTPVPQDDGEAPLVPILYSPAYSQAMDLLRALLPADEVSGRALALTEHLVKLAPSSYTAWYYRAHILVDGPENSSGLGSKRDRLANELVFLDDLAKQNMKNYQVWQHRKLVVEALHDPSRELAFTGRVFDKDAKNYHTWVYRQWILARFGGLPPTADAGETSSSTPTPAQSAATPTHPSIWDGELIFVEERLRQDARNNSAWNHRYYCIFGSGHAQALGEEGGESTSSRRLCADVWRLGTSFDECVEHEIEYAKQQIKTIPHNASAWNFLRGVAKLSVQRTRGTSGGYPFACAVDLATSLVPSASEAQQNPAIDTPPRSPPQALEWLLDHVDAQLQQQPSAAVDELVVRATALVSRLCVADVVRRRFWAYRLAAVRRHAASAASP